MLKTLADVVYIEGQESVPVSVAQFCRKVAASSDAGIAAVSQLPEDTMLVMYALTCPQDFLALEAWLNASRRYALVVVADAANSDLLLQAMEAGADDYLLNPEQQADLAWLTLQRAISRKQALLQSQQTYDELEQLNLELMTSLDLLQQDQQAGRYVQQKMLPESPWHHRQQSFRYMICPSLYLSGDFIDYFPAGREQVLFYLADVSGHGASSAFITILLRVYIRRYVKKALRQGDDVEPEKILSEINNELLETNLGKHLTIFLGVLDLQSGRLRYSNGAHFPYPVLVSAEGDIRYIEGKGLPVGLFADAAYETFELLLHPRYHLLLFSDGVFEVMQEDALAAKEQGLLQIAGQFAGDFDAMVAHFSALGMQNSPDDVSFLAVSGL